MPGIFGLCDFSERLDLLCEVQKTAKILCYNSFFETGFVIRKNGAVGAVGLGIEPISNFVGQTEGSSLVFHGKIFNLSELCKDSSTGSDSAKLLALYHNFGPKFIPRLKGSFVLAIWDQRNQRLLIVNDRFGTRPLYYITKPRLLAFSSEAKAFLGLSQLSRKINFVALAEFFSFGLVLENKTLLEDINLLPPASILTVSPEKLELRSYWKAYFSDSNFDFEREKAVEKCYHLLLKAVKQNLHSNQPPGLFLSGGLDSRLPFYDYDFADFALSLPAREKVWAKFYRYFLTRKFPQVSRIAYQRSGFAVNAPLSLLLVKKILDRIGIKLGDKGLRRLTPSYLDYPNWSRKELKRFILSVLGKDNFSARDLFNYPYVEQLLNQHFHCQAEHSAKIGLLLCFELWHRQFLNRDHWS